MKKQMSQDDIYIDKFLSGDKEGFEMLVRAYQDRVLNVVCSFIGRDREGEDVTQEVFLKVYDNLGSFKRNCRFFTWVYRIAVNTAYDFLRKRKNFVDNEEAVERIASPVGGPDEALLKKEKEEIVKSALAGIPLKYRTALILKDIEGLSYKEISEVLKCSIGTVESKIYRARQFLKEELFKLGGNIL